MINCPPCRAKEICQATGKEREECAAEMRKRNREIIELDIFKTFDSEAELKQLEL